jgi:signal transduction histidine kinase
MTQGSGAADTPRADRVGRIVVETVPYLIVAVVAGFTVSGGAGTTATYTLLVGAAAWMLGMFTLPRGLRTHAGAMGVFVAGLFAIFCALTAIDAWYGVLALVGYVYSFAVVAWPWRLIAVSAFAVLAAVAQANGLHGQDAAHLTVSAAIVLVNVGAMCFLAWIYHSMRSLADERRRALDDNDRLREQLVARARADARADERQRLAREIHDTVAQGLVAVITQLDAVDLSGQRMPDPDDRRHLEQASAIARESLREARRAVSELAPADLDGADLTTAVQRTTERWGLRAGIATRVSLPEAAGAPDPAVSAALVRILQEALANIARHAHASLACVTLTRFPDAVVLDVADDGVGFDPGADSGGPGARGGYGLTAMRDRMAAVGGTVEVESTSSGTVVSARAPLAPPVSPGEEAIR